MTTQFSMHDSLEGFSHRADGLNDFEPPGRIYLELQPFVSRLALIKHLIKNKNDLYLQEAWAYLQLLLDEPSTWMLLIESFSWIQITFKERGP